MATIEELRRRAAGGPVEGEQAQEGTTVEMLRQRAAQPAAEAAATAEVAPEMPWMAMPTAETGAYLQDQLVRGAGNFLSLPGAIRDLGMTGAEKAMGTLGIEPAPREAVQETAGKAARLLPGPLGGAMSLFADAPGDVLGAVQSTGFDPLTGAQPGSVAERTTGEFLEGATSFPFFPGISGFANVSGKTTGRGARDLGFGETGQTVAEVGGGILGGMGAGALKQLPAALKAKPPAAMTGDELRTAANAAYADARAIGANVKPVAYRDFATKAIKRAGRINEKLHPKASGALDEISTRLRSVQTIEDMDELRRIVSGAASGASPDDARIVQSFVNSIDDFMEGLAPQQLVTGSPAAVESLKQGRQYWKRFRKSQQIEDAIDRAGMKANMYTGSGFENALRQEFRRMSLNDKAMRGFTKAEVEAIRDVARGGPITNALRQLAKFSPKQALTGSMAAGAGGYLGGPVGAGAVMGGTELSRLGAQALTGQRAMQALELARRGGVPPGITPGRVLGEGRTIGQLVGSLQAPHLLEQRGLMD